VTERNTSNLSTLHCPKLEQSVGHHKILRGSIFLLLFAKLIATKNGIWRRHQYLENLQLDREKLM
jgi:hypothetical protein